ncbi:Uncharacterized protein BP5553_04358 [Venustampulla echinocandica]|uniref:Enoyl-CoA hydratase n=1 Tax=Venustampulla echinocandica TaxID=2656787 RepID=A0A370TX12_9HELO|nr:Uncharacterized protein BP5553_04358 [Venustampulla echinocandica]RDL40018.1 Uncharacterized protein BP5553_04358 [Venustampulla echinocandica]
MARSSFTTAPPEVRYVLLTFPAPHVLLVTINLAKQMNSLPVAACWEMDRVWKWFDAEDELRVGIVTGAGNKAFSAGMDLKEHQAPNSTNSSPDLTHYPPTGFAGLTRRVGKKPIIAAVNGHAHGGGFEIALNSDIVLASRNATFRLPDVMRGTAALEGAFPRICRTFGLQRAMLLALTAYTLGAVEAKEWGLVAQVVGEEDVVREAVKMANLMAGFSPDSLIVSRAGVRQAWETASVDQSTSIISEKYAKALMSGENALEGMKAFKEKRAPKWTGSKL